MHQMPLGLQVTHAPARLGVIQLSSLVPAVRWVCLLTVKLVAAQLRRLVPAVGWAGAQPGRRLQLRSSQPRLCAGPWQPCSQQPSWPWPRALLQ